MNREEILRASRKENNNQDLAEQDIQKQGGYWSSITATLAFAMVSLMASMKAGVYLYAPAFIYFSMITTQWTVRYLRQRKKTDLAVAAVLGLIAVLSLIQFTVRLYGVNG